MMPVVSDGSTVTLTDRSTARPPKARFRPDATRCPRLTGASVGSMSCPQECLGELRTVTDLAGSSAGYLPPGGEQVHRRGDRQREVVVLLSHQDGQPLSDDPGQRLPERA